MVSSVICIELEIENTIETIATGIPGPWGSWEARVGSRRHPWYEQHWPTTPGNTRAFRGRAIGWEASHHDKPGWGEQAAVWAKEHRQGFSGWGWAAYAASSRYWKGVSSDMHASKHSLSPLPDITPPHPHYLISLPIPVTWYQRAWCGRAPQWHCPGPVWPQEDRLPPPSCHIRSWPQHLPFLLWPQEPRGGGWVQSVIFLSLKGQCT